MRKVSGSGILSLVAKVLVCFGKVSRVRYSVDYADPLSSIQAFSIALTTFMKKRLSACNCLLEIAPS